MPDVHSVYATVRLPSDGDPGQVTMGYYTLEGGILTMTDSKGVPVRKLRGELYRVAVRPCDDATAIAGRLTKEIRMARRGETSTAAGFHRKLNYPKSGVC